MAVDGRYPRPAHPADETAPPSLGAARGIVTAAERVGGGGGGGGGGGAAVPPSGVRACQLPRLSACRGGCSAVPSGPHVTGLRRRVGRRRCHRPAVRVVKIPDP